MVRKGVYWSLSDLSRFIANVHAKPAWLVSSFLFVTLFGYFTYTFHAAPDRITDLMQMEQRAETYKLDFGRLDALVEAEKTKTNAMDKCLEHAVATQQKLRLGQFVDVSAVAAGVELVEKARQELSSDLAHIRGTTFQGPAFNDLLKGIDEGLRTEDVLLVKMVDWYKGFIGSPQDRHAVVLDHIASFPKIVEDLQALDTRLATVGERVQSIERQSKVESTALEQKQTAYTVRSVLAWGSLSYCVMYLAGVAFYFGRFSVKRQRRRRKGCRT